MFLKIENIDTYYDATHILFGVSLEVAEGETVSVLGRNGVGKTTLLRSIIGLTPPRKGNIYFQERKISGRQPFRIARRGVGFVPEDRDIFPNLSVRENLEMGMQKKQRPHRMGSGQDIHLVSYTQTAAQPVGGDPFRRGAADAHHCQNPNGQPQPAAAG